MTTIAAITTKTKGTRTTTMAIFGTSTRTTISSRTLPRKSHARQVRSRCSPRFRTLNCPLASWFPSSGSRTSTTIRWSPKRFVFHPPLPPTNDSCPPWKRSTHLQVTSDRAMAKAGKS
uniref:(northern house mosquito) hypothetical protein n=1 Tax=Culex pipiens TaxID=7175 RepID=A0A8D8B161_CULPI